MKDPSGVDDAAARFTSVAGRRFASPSFRQLKALSSRLSAPVALCRRGSGYRVSESLPESIPFKHSSVSVRQQILRRRRPGVGAHRM
jgi:hypothetical protein